MSAKKKQAKEEKEEKPSKRSFGRGKGGFPKFLIYLFLFVGGYYSGVYREDIKQFAKKYWPVVQEKGEVVGEKLKEGVDYTAPKIKKGFENVAERFVGDNETDTKHKHRLPDPTPEPKGK